MKKNTCKHLDLTHLDSDMVASNKVYDDNGDILEYDDFKLYIFLCKKCGEIVVKNWLRSHFKAEIKHDEKETSN